MVCEMRTCGRVFLDAAAAPRGDRPQRIAFLVASMMKARSASGNRSKMKFMIFSISVSWSVTAPSAMLTWAIACSLCTVFSRSLRPALLVSTTGAKRVASTDRVITVGVWPRSASISEWNTSWAEASASSSPSRSACQAPGASRSPPTKVPLRECRSSTK
jgi:hypothetical protein